MTTVTEKSGSAPTTPTQPSADERVYTRYCAAPHPVHPVGEPRIVHTLLLATWLGRLIDPLPHHEHEKPLEH